MKKQENKKYIFFVLITLPVLVVGFFIFQNALASPDELQVKEFSFASLDSTSRFSLDQAGYSIDAIDLGGDGTNELALGVPAGNEPRVELRRADGSLINSFLVYNENFRDGVVVRDCDLDQNGKSEILTIPRAGGGPHMRIFDGYGQPIIPGFFAYDESYTSGMDAACINSRTSAKQLIATIGGSEQKEVRIYDLEGNLQNSFPVTTVSDDARIASIDLGGDGHDEILISSGIGEQPLLEIYRTDGSLVNSFLVYGEGVLSGFNVRSADLDNDNKEEIVVIPRTGSAAHIRVLDGYGQEKITSANFIGDQEYRGGFDLAIGNFGQGLGTLLVPQAVATGRTDLYKYIEVDVSDQTFKCYQNGYLVYDLITSTGKPSTPTKIGTFDAFAKYEMAYGGADGQRWGMPYFISFYTVHGIENGIHELPFLNGRREGEGSLGRAVSHGCVRLAIGDAKKVFDWVETGKTKVIVQP